MQTVEAMRAGERRKVKFSYTPTQKACPKDLDLGFAIKDCEGSDTNPANNNTLAAKMEVKRANSFRISAISGDCDSNANAVVLKWNVPDESGIPRDVHRRRGKLRRFCHLQAWAHGRCKMCDGSLNYLMSDGQGSMFEWDNCREKQAFIVFNTSEFGKTMGFVPTSGEYFAVWPAAGTANDDWLISPELPGDAQLISFYARSLGEKQRQGRNPALRF